MFAADSFSTRLAAGRARSRGIAITYLIDSRTRLWAIVAVVVGVVLFLGLELVEEPELSLGDLLLELVSIVPVVMTSVGVALLFRVAQRQRDEHLQVIRDLELARVQGQRGGPRRGPTSTVWARRSMCSSHAGISRSRARSGAIAAERTHTKEIAQVRAASERTVREQARAVYTKSTLTGARPCRVLSARPARPDRGPAVAIHSHHDNHNLQGSRQWPIATHGGRHCAGCWPLCSVAGEADEAPPPADPTADAVDGGRRGRRGRRAATAPHGARRPPPPAGALHRGRGPAADAGRRIRNRMGGVVAARTRQITTRSDRRRRCRAWKGAFDTWGKTCRCSRKQSCRWRKTCASAIRGCLRRYVERGEMWLYSEDIAGSGIAVELAG